MRPNHAVNADAHRVRRALVVAGYLGSFGHTSIHKTERKE